MHPSRRKLLRLAAPAAAATMLPLRAQAPECRVELLVKEPVGTIAPEIYGHFVEHLGGVVYDGIWVGENSRIPNVGGMRKALLDALVKIKPAVIRWPGGCYADQYDWRDGIGPREKRPRRTNFWLDSNSWPANAAKTGDQKYEPNLFGTVEFARFCRLAGGKPYFAANLRSLPAQEFWRWVEYCNSPAGSNTLANQRAADGETNPLDVPYWGVGNESWGCGGNFQPEDYAIEYKRYAAWVPNYGKAPQLVGAGPNGGDLEWTRKFFQKAGPNVRMWGWALHHYSWNASAGRTNDWDAGKRDALRFDDEQYYEILREGLKMEDLIENHWRVLGEVDRQHRIKLVVDEWGTWHAPGTEPFAEALIGQQNTMRDAVLAGLTMDIFNRHADKVAMAAIAQLVNCLQSPFLAHEDKFCLTPTYHVFDLYTPHQGGQSVRTLLSAPKASYSRNGKTELLPGLSASASRKGNTLTVTLTNPNHNASKETEVVLRGGAASSAQIMTLAAPDVHAHNTFAAPNAVQPKAGTVTVAGGRVVCTLPPGSVSRLTVQIS